MTARRLRAATAASLGVLLLLAVGTPAFASSSVAPITVRRVDTTAVTANPPATDKDPKQVTIDVQTGPHTLSTGSVTLVENGRPVSVTSVDSLSHAQIQRDTVLLVDTASSMTGAKMTATQAALKQVIADKAPADQMAVVAYGTTARTVQGFTADQNSLIGAVDRLAIGGNAVLDDGVVLSANLLAAQSGSLPQLVIFADSNDVGSSAKGSSALAAVLSSNALTYTIGLQFTPGVDLSQPAAFASAGGGKMFGTSFVGATPEAVTSMLVLLDGQYRITYDSSIAPGRSGDLVITAPGLSGRAQIVPGGVAVGQATNPPVVHLAQAPGLLRGKTGLLVVAILVLAAAALLTYAATLLLTREGSALSTALSQFSGEHVASEDSGGMIQSQLVKRAVDATGRLANDRGLLEVVESKLEQADLALRPAEAIFVYLIGAVLLTAAALFVGGPLLALIALILLIITPPAVLNFMAARRLRKFTSQLPDTLQLLASSLRAGFSFLQGVEAVAEEVDDPMGSELRRVIVEARLGRPVDEALDECAGRMKSEDFDWAVMAVKIQREVGGNLADLLQTVSITMIERERLRRDVKSLTAEGRMSGMVLGFLPPGLGVVFYVTNPKYIGVLFHNVGGEIALGVAVVAMLIGFFWMKKIVDIKV